ncbi:MAG: hypothetical protein M1834_007997 [Cirrosporium novae-zelandiae]|nr:MAG: hypothetical protein M1834_007997 [Cirrosporium novae-zelandiae]
MVSREASSRLFSLAFTPIRSSSRKVSFLTTSARAASTSTTPGKPATAAPTSTTTEDVIPDSSFSTPGPSSDIIQSFDPVKQSAARGFKLPRSRYQARPPKYYRGPLHPYQPPRPADPVSREFIPGPFSLPRLQQTYGSTVAPDLMTLAYMHVPPGFQAPPKAQRLRQWDDSSPYHKNRALRGPRGGDVLRLLRKPLTFRNLPKLEKVTVHSFVKGATESSAFLHVAGMAIQAITNARVTVFKTRHPVPNWGLKRGKTVACTATLQGENMYHFLSKLITVVLPRIKDWPGVKGSSGDSSGNISFGFDGQTTALFPEIEVNYDMYPPKMIPGAHVTIHTSATNDRDARLLLTALGFPFYGNHIN